MSEAVTNPINQPQPAPSIAAVANQRTRQWADNSNFYSMLPAAYMTFYNNWVRYWLQWYDGYVPEIHGTQNGLLSTCIGTTLVNRCADSVFGGDIMFSNARKPKLIAEINGKMVGKALDFISNKWMKQINGKAVIKRAGKDALGGGFSILKLNRTGGELWLDELRADRFYIDKAGDKIRRCVSVLSFYDAMSPKKEGDRYVLVEDRHFEQVSMFGDEIPVVEYKMYRTSVQIQYFTGTGGDNCVRWEELPKDVRRAFKAEYDCRLNAPQAINGFRDLGVYILPASDGVSNVPQIGLGESILANITTYLYEYDYYNTAFNTDMYLSRGRVLAPKVMQSPLAEGGGFPSGLDEFLYTKYPSQSAEDQKPIPIQFEMRSEAWRGARNILLESIATGIGLSVSTLASYLSDASNRTAREVSSEESATALFIENMRRRWEGPINDMLSAVLRFYGYEDDVEVRWTRAGMSNQSVLVDTLSRAVQAGLISQKKAHHAFNFDDDEEQNEEDYQLVMQETRARENAMSLYDDLDHYGAAENSPTGIGTTAEYGRADHRGSDGEDTGTDQKRISHDGADAPDDR